MDFSIFLIIGLLISGLLAVWPTLTSVLVSIVYWFIVLLWSLNLFNPFAFNTIPWVNLLNISINYQIDGLARLFALLISGIGILVLFYAYIYTNMETYKRAKLLSLLQLFAISMLGIVVADDMIMLFLCWELTTITSYLLIQFKVQSESANQAASNSLFVTIIGSLAMLAGLILLENKSASWSIASTINQLTTQVSSPQCITAFSLILLAIITKSAQFPFYFWLPGAMKAPTPVSAYLHSATMVNAGIYLLARLHPLFGQLSIWYPLLTFFGLSTMAISSVLCLVQKDLKALLAYTTTFALGAMVYLLGSDQPLAIEAFAIFFLFHGIYKAAAFMLVGTLDKEYHTRELDKLSGVGRTNFLLAFVLIIILGSMAGLPPFFGFTVKEMIYEAKLATPTISYFIVGISLLSSMLIAAICFRCGWFLFKAAKKTHIKVKILKFGLLCPAILAGVILILSFFEESLQDLVQPSIAAIVPATKVIYVNPNVGSSYLLSLTTVLGGAFLSLLFILIKKLPTSVPDLLNPRLLFENSLNYLLLFGKQLTRFTQEQSLTIQLKIATASIVIFLLLTMIVTQWYKLIHYQVFSVNVTNLPLFILLILVAVSLLSSYKFLYNLISLSLLGLATGFFFMVNGAVDLAMTQLLVEVLTIIVILIALHKFRLINIYNKSSISLLNIAIAIGIGLYTTLMLLLVKATPFNPELQQYYIKNSLLLAYGKNVVNVILVDFRSLDTFGEAIVIIATAIGIWLLTHKSLLSIRKKHVRHS